MLKMYAFLEECLFVCLNQKMCSIDIFYHVFEYVHKKTNNPVVVFLIDKSYIFLE